MSASHFDEEEGHTRPLLSHYLLLPVSLKGVGGLNIQNRLRVLSVPPLVDSLLEHVAALRKQTLQVTGLTEQQVKWLIWTIGSQWTLSFPVTFTNCIGSLPSALPCVACIFCNGRLVILSILIHVMLLSIMSIFGFQWCNSQLDVHTGLFMNHGEVH